MRATLGTQRLSASHTAPRDALSSATEGGSQSQPCRTQAKGGPRFLPCGVKAECAQTSAQGEEAPTAQASRHRPWGPVLSHMAPINSAPHRGETTTGRKVGASHGASDKGQGSNSRKDMWVRTGVSQLPFRKDIVPSTQRETILKIPTREVLCRHRNGSRKPGLQAWPPLGLTCFLCKRVLDQTVSKGSPSVTV